MDVHFSSKTDLWATPQNTFDALAAEFGPFDLDVCATPENAKCARYYTRDDDGLSQPWDGVCWMNPPYGREIKAWMRKAYKASQNGATVVCLVPARTDTAWWHDYAMKGQIRFLRGRLKFGGAANSAPFPSAVVVFANTTTPPAPSIDENGLEIGDAASQEVLLPNNKTSSFFPSAEPPEPAEKPQHDDTSYYEA